MALTMSVHAVRTVAGTGDVAMDEDMGGPEVIEERAQLSDADFKRELAAVIPHLRAFGRSLSGNRDLADDLVQETLLKAWAARSRFQAGTNMRAWTFIILRNHYLSQMRRSRFRGDWDDLTADRILAAPAGQDKHVELSDMQRALLQLPQPQREALILVGAGGFAYEEAAEICGVAVGTIKSRVARGRTSKTTGGRVGSTIVNCRAALGSSPPAASRASVSGTDPVSCAAGAAQRA